jgi:hypothetical protein
MFLFYVVYAVLVHTLLYNTCIAGTIVHKYVLIKGIVQPLKVDGNEKLVGLRFLQLLGIGLGLWRSMSIFILNIPFANAKLISVSAHSSEMNRRLVCN